MKKRGVLILLLMISTFVNSQSRAISTVAPVLLINSDARSAGMGDQGVATTSDASAIYHNAAKMAFNTSQYTIGVNYTPWLKNLVDGLFVGGGSMVNRINERSAWGVNLRYFSLGDIDLFDNQANFQGTEDPAELTIAGSYSLKLSDYYSMGVSLRYIRSDLAINVQNNGIKPINGLGVDVSGYYQGKERNYGEFNGRFRAGFNISNLGPKVTYTDAGEENFLPTRMRLGAGFDFILDDYNTVAVTFETSKLLVPTPPIYENGVVVEGNDPTNIGWVEGIFKSFGDAPGGSSEEFKEFTYSLGAEYLYNNAFAIRAGYFHESEIKGNRQHFTLGGGLKAKSFNIDLSYLMNASDVNNPLERTLRFSLSFDLGDIYENF